MTQTFERQDLSNSDFTGRDLRGWSFHRCILNGARFDDSDLTNARITQCDVIGASFKRSNLSSVRFHGQWMSFANGAEIAGSVMRGCSFSSADLSDALMAGVDLTDCDFTDAILIGTDFRGLNSQLPEGISPKNAVLSGAKLRNVKYDKTTVWPTGFQPPAASPATKLAEMATKRVRQTLISGNSLPFPPLDGSAPKTQKFPAAPEMGIDPTKRYTATMETSMGTLVIALDAARAPKTVNNFVYLAAYHYYDGIIFHRIINGFVCQGGDPTGTGMGNPGYRFEDELPKPGQYQIGSLAMANAGPNTNGSQFFLISGQSGVQLPPAYALFGQVVKGLDVVDAMQKVPTARGDRPIDDVVINSVTITVAD